MNKRNIALGIGLLSILVLVAVSSSVSAQQLPSAEDFSALTGGKPYVVVKTNNFGFNNNLPISLTGKNACTPENTLGNLYSLKAQETEAVKAHNIEVQKTVDEITNMGKDLTTQRDSLKKAVNLVQTDRNAIAFKTSLSKTIDQINEVKKTIASTTNSDTLKSLNEKLDGLNNNLSLQTEKMKNTKLKGPSIFSAGGMTWGEADAIINKYAGTGAPDVFSADLLAEKGIGIIDEKTTLAKEQIKRLDESIRENSTQQSEAKAEMMKLPSHGITTQKAMSVASSSQGRQTGYIWPDGKNKPIQQNNCISEEDAIKQGATIVTSENVAAVNYQFTSSGQPKVRTQSLRNINQDYYDTRDDIRQKRSRGEITFDEANQMLAQARRNRNVQSGDKVSMYYDILQSNLATESHRFSIWQRLRSAPNSPMYGKSYDDPITQQAIDNAMLASRDFVSDGNPGKDIWMLNAYIAAKNDTSNPCWGASISDTACRNSLEQGYRNRYNNTNALGSPSLRGLFTPLKTLKELNLTKNNFTNACYGLGMFSKECQNQLNMGKITLEKMTFPQQCPMDHYPVVSIDNTTTCVPFPNSLGTKQIQEMFPENCDKSGNCYNPELYSGTLYCEDSTGKCFPPSKANCPKGVIEDYVTATTEGLCRKITKDPWWSGTVLDSKFTGLATKTFAKDNNLSLSATQTALKKAFGAPTQVSPSQSDMILTGTGTTIMSYTVAQAKDIANVYRKAYEQTPNKSQPLSEKNSENYYLNIRTNIISESKKKNQSTITPSEKFYIDLLDKMNFVAIADSKKQIEKRNSKYWLPQRPSGEKTGKFPRWNDIGWDDDPTEQPFYGYTTLKFYDW